MAYETIDYEFRDGVGWITLNRPKALNALNLQMAKELWHLATRCSSDPSLRAVVLTGSGEKAYCAGGDIADFVERQDDIEFYMKEMTTYLHMAISRFAWMRAPLIGAINGVAAGAGLSAVAFCDLAIASDKATFTSAYTKIGLTPDGSSTYFLSRILGTRRTTELYLTNRVLSSQEALDWGLINKVVPAGQLLDEAGKLAAELASGPTEAFGGVKKLMQMALIDSLESQMERETRSIAELSTTADAREGVTAFIERRNPKFLGN